MASCRLQIRGAGCIGKSRASLTTNLSAISIIAKRTGAVNNMPNTGLNEPYHLSSERIDEVVTKTSPGTYALEREDSSDSFRS